MDFYRKVYRLDITLKSPLSVGSGSNENTDKDIIVDSAGNPFIPASSLAGVLRSYIEATNGRVTANTMFGYLPVTDEEKEKAKNGDPEYIERPSEIMFYDGLYYGEKKGFFITTRDMVALENKVAKDSAKFDMQAVETGTGFTAYIELLDKSFPEALEAALAAMNAGVLRLGSKTSRGYGQVALKAHAKEISDAGVWADFDMMKADSWDSDSLINLTESKESKITVGLKLTGGISIREYTTEPSTDNETAPDYRQMALHDDGLTPVIPGTSWSGAFRARFSEFCGNNENIINDLFGFVIDRKKAGNDNKNNDPKDSAEPEAKKSNISFSESKIRGGLWKKITRNAIDRFTGGTKAGALYTEETYYGGDTELVISFREKPCEKTLQKIAACLADLHNGFLAVGGLTAVGRGLFEITSINSTDLSEDDKKPENIFAAITKEVCK